MAVIGTKQVHRLWAAVPDLETIPTRVLARENGYEIREVQVSGKSSVLHETRHGMAADVTNTVWIAVVSGGSDRHGEPQRCMGLFRVFPGLQHPCRVPVWQGDSTALVCTWSCRRSESSFLPSSWSAQWCRQSKHCPAICALWLGRIVAAREWR